MEVSPWRPGSVRIVHPKKSWAMPSDCIGTQLTLAVLDMAYLRRRPGKDLIFHGDRGVQYAVKVYRGRLEAYGI